MSAHQQLKIARVIARLNVGGPATQAILILTGSACAVPSAIVTAIAASANFSERMKSSQDDLVVGEN